MTSQTPLVDFLIVGAGIAGLCAARTLQAAGKTVALLEKGRGFGGRLATRRWEGAVFDHGAQFFTQRDEEFAPVVESLRGEGIIQSWFQKADTGATAWIGLPGINAVAKALAEGLTVHRQTRADKIERSGDLWTVTAESGTTFTARHLIITAPLPQALALWKTSGLALPAADAAALGAVRYTRCIAGLFVLEGPSGIGQPGHLSLSEDPTIAWVADCQQKGNCPDQPAVVCHSTPAFGEAHWDSPDEVRLPLLEAALRPHIEATVRIGSCHRWGYSHCLNPLSDAFWTSPELGVSFAGDSFLAARVEGAALSGLRLGKALGE